jgi:hypothetical protein
VLCGGREGLRGAEGGGGRKRPHLSKRKKKKKDPISSLVADGGLDVL